MSILVLGLALQPVVEAAPQSTGEAPLLVVLTETGETREELPVYALHPDGEAIAATLSRGVSGVLLRAYRKEQEYLRRERGTRPEPAYLLMSTRQGGFARYGFWLGDREKPDAAYVDLHRDWPLTGRFAAMDQLLPHELFHAIRSQLVGPADEGFANQVHALGVRTDRGVAFNEGFAEHLQALALEHPDAAPETRALAGDDEALARVTRDLAAYRRELTARIALATRMRMGFLAWFSNGEDVLRYHAVKSNAYARIPPLPERLLGPDPYAAYLLESVLPGSPQDPPKSVGRLAQTEGVVAALMFRWANTPELRDTYRGPDFYRRFGVELAPGEPDPAAAMRRIVAPLENVYLKIFEVLYLDRPTGVLEMAGSYRARFPDEAAAVDRVLGWALLGQDPDPAPEIWLANPDFRTGTTLFDQLRGLPRMHTFELNSASLVDLVAVPGVDAELARAIRSARPFRSLDRLADVPGMDAAHVRRFEAMRGELERWLEEAAIDEEELSLRAILWPYGRRLAWTALLAAALGAGLLRRVRGRGGRRPPSWPRAGLDGLGAALLGIPGGWLVGTLLADTAIAGIAPGLGAAAVVGFVLGIPATCWWAWRRKPRGDALTVLLAWMAAALPAALIVTPLL